ncbi:CBS domain-containing protein [Aliiglaciecola sp. LCG003]|uniref:CBS domain-containing protein n=1 Tax=Aliiglaciecola sp. LCG003 TaxID=3053655 RepID=UPI002573EF44|nr:CBS domain-containing protein [Aliiglaciecola sp. LCG003]WJG09435.1 CBS domain-containing protein [Aliiglaciecola sp. LCG003]
MQIKTIMTPDVVTVTMDDTLAHVKRLFELNSFHHILVVAEAKLVGILSDRDLFKAISPNINTSGETNKDLATLNKRVHQIMTRKLITIDAEKGMFHAIQLFNRHKISCLPVVNSDNKPIGILSWRDILYFIEKNQLERHKT